MVTLTFKSYIFYPSIFLYKKSHILKIKKGDGILLSNVLNRLINITKENNVAKKLISELGEVIEGKIPRKEQSLIQELLEQNKLTTRYRDKMNVERCHILNDYAEQTATKGAMYYIYNKDDDEVDIFHLCICDKENSRKIIKVKGSDLPEEAGVDSVLRMENGKYILDKVATNKVYEKMEEMVQQLLEEQNQKMEEYRIEGHSYKFVENSGDSIWLRDITIDKNTGECFEELVFTKETFENAKQGEIFQYQNGEYIRCRYERKLIEQNLTKNVNSVII